MSHTAAAEAYPVYREDDHYARHCFFEALLMGGLSEQEIWNRAEKLDLELGARCYTVAVMTAPAEPGGDAGAYAQPAARIHDGMMSCFLKYPEYLLLGRGFGTCTILIMSDAENMNDSIRRCADTVKTLYETYDPGSSWYLAVGKPTGHITGLPGCYEQTRRLWAWRYISPEQHVLGWDTVEFPADRDSGGIPDALDVKPLDGASIAKLLKNAGPAEISGFVDGWVTGQREALKSEPFCHYLMLSIRYGAAAFVQSLGVSSREYLEGMEPAAGNMTGAELKKYLTQMLLRAIELRDREDGGKHRKLVKRAADYLDEHYCRADLCLGMAAREAGVSPNYLSAVFSREMGITFVDYLTAKRMEKARELLRTTGLRSGQIAAAVGYQDPRYFSALFRKVHGCTPGAYRSGK